MTAPPFQALVDEHRGPVLGFLRGIVGPLDPDSAPSWLGGTGGPGMSSRDGAVWNAVANLPEGQRAAVVLRFAIDLRYREIGDALECSEDAARRRVHDGLRNLRTATAPAEKEAAR